MVYEPKRNCRGQALAEGVIVLFLLIVLWMVVTILGKYQTFTEQTAQASRWAGWVQTRLPTDQRWQTAEMEKIYFPSRAQSIWLQPEHAIIQGIQHSQKTVNLTPMAQIGGTHQSVTTLRRDWGLEGEQMVQSRTAVELASFASNRDHPILGEAKAWNIPVSRHHVVLVGAGHASNASVMQQAPERSHLAWNQPIERLQQSGKSLQIIADRVDAPWKRQIQWDWLSSWQGYIPERSLAPYR